MELQDRVNKIAHGEETVHQNGNNPRGWEQLRGNGTNSRKGLEQGNSQERGLDLSEERLGEKGKLKEIGPGTEQ